MSAGHLPTELLIEIFCGGISAADLARVCCTCRQFRDIADPLLYTTVSLASADQLCSFILALISKPDRGVLVRSLTVDWSRELLEEQVQRHLSGFWRFHTQPIFGDDSAHHFVETDGDLTRIDQEATAHDLVGGLCYAIREHVASAHVVLLLDMLPRLHSLHVIPSEIEYWFWAAFHACKLDAAKRLPRGLLSLESLDVHYRPGRYISEDPSLANSSVGYAHIKLISALLLPNLRRLSFSGDAGDDRIWQRRYMDSDGIDESLRVDMARLQNRSGVTELKLRGAEMPPYLLLQMLDMLAAPERVHIEREDGEDFTTFDAFIARPTLRSFTLVDYPWHFLPVDRPRQPLSNLSACDHLTHLALPVRAIALDEEDDLASKLPRGIQHLDLAYVSPGKRSADFTRLVKLARSLGESGRPVQRLIIRPEAGHVSSDRVRAACDASGILFSEEPWIVAPAIGNYGFAEDMDEMQFELGYDDLHTFVDEYSDVFDPFGEIAGEKEFNEESYSPTPSW